MEKKRLFGLVLLQFSKVGDIPLQFTYFETYHCNSLVLTKMSLNTYGSKLGPTAGVYEYVYFAATFLPYH
jgi:hypothetical protein